MKNISAIFILLSLSGLFGGCSNKKDNADAYGNFEAVEVMVSSQANGKIMRLAIEEGDVLKENEKIGYVDTLQLHLKKQQLQATIQALQSKTQNVKIQIEVLQKEMANLERDKRRIQALLLDSAATSKQLDDINGAIAVTKQKIAATRSQLNTANRGILSEIKPLEIQIRQLEDQIEKSIITNPIRGTVLTKYAEESEITAFGKPLYKIANLEKINLRAYISGDQLSQVKLGQKVTVQIDEPGGKSSSHEGVITWIASQAEFTPKIIQTKEERVNLVYAFKVEVPNDGSMKIGMPGEVYFSTGQ